MRYFWRAFVHLLEGKLRYSDPGLELAVLRRWLTDKPLPKGPVYLPWEERLSLDQRVSAGLDQKISKGPERRKRQNRGRS